MQFLDSLSVKSAELKIDESIGAFENATNELVKKLEDPGRKVHSVKTTVKKIQKVPWTIIGMSMLFVVTFFVSRKIIKTRF